MAKVKVGVIGGSGLGDALGAGLGGRAVQVDTPFGEPSDAIVETVWGDVDVAFLNRHGPGHVLPPSRVNYRANIYALKAAGLHARHRLRGGRLACASTSARRTW